MTNGIYADGMEAVADELRQEALDDAKDQLTELASLLDGIRQGQNPGDGFIAAASQTALKMRHQAGNIELRLIGTIAHRLEDYLSSIQELSAKVINDVQVYIDLLEDIIEGRTALDSDAAQIVRELPHKNGFSEADIEVRSIEVMLVMLHGTANHYVQRELQQCGYRVTTVSTVFEALPLIVQTKPDLIIISALMPELNGIDLAIGLSSMPATRNIPLALITSLDKDDEKLSLLSKSIPIIIKGPSFGDDLFTALDNLFLI